METFHNGLLLLLVAVLRPSSSLFVPEQLPTLLSFVYTNIPPIRKGIDSRVGFGFRLGPNADVQVMLELGPQQNTAPIGPQKSDGNSKRETRFPSYRPKRPLQAPKGTWLEAWRQQQQQQGMIVEGEEEDVGVMPAPVQPTLDRDIIAHLQQLYKEQPMIREAKDVKHVKKSPKRHRTALKKENDVIKNQDTPEEPKVMVIVDRKNDSPLGQQNVQAEIEASLVQNYAPEMVSIN